MSLPDINTSDLKIDYKTAPLIFKPMKLEFGKNYGIRILDKSVDEKKIDVLCYKKNLKTTLGGNIAGNKVVGDKVDCPICESERINNRFEILDL